MHTELTEDKSDLLHTISRLGSERKHKTRILLRDAWLASTAAVRAPAEAP